MRFADLNHWQKKAIKAKWDDKPERPESCEPKKRVPKQEKDPDT